MRVLHDACIRWYAAVKGVSLGALKCPYCKTSAGGATVIDDSQNETESDREGRNFENALRYLQSPATPPRNTRGSSSGILRHPNGAPIELHIEDEADEPEDDEPED